MKCSDCRFYVSTDIGQGECRRNPPNVVLMQMAGLQMQSGVAGMFPPTKADNWCGEHVDKPTDAQ